MASDKIKTILNEKFSSEKSHRKMIVDQTFKTINGKNIKTVLTKEELYLIIDEAVTNAMEHGNKWNPDKQIEITIINNSNHLKIIVSDEGEGFIPKNNEFSKTKKDTLGPRGRGIYIIQQLCKPTWNKDGNEITLEIKTKA